MRLFMKCFICIVLLVVSMLVMSLEKMQSSLPDSYSVETSRILEDPHISQITYYKRNIQFLGISFNKDHYMANETLMIYDDAKVCPNVRLGRKMHNDQEIVLSKNSALKFTKHLHFLLGKQVMLYYNLGRRVKGVKVTIVGIAPPSFKDTLYMYKGASLSYLKELYHVTTPDYAIFYLRHDRDLDSLKSHYPSLQFHNISTNYKLTTYEHVLILFLIILGMLYFKVGESQYSITGLLIDSLMYLSCVVIACLIMRVLSRYLIESITINQCSGFFTLWYLIGIVKDLLSIIRKKQGDFGESEKEVGDS